MSIDFSKKNWKLLDEETEESEETNDEYSDFETELRDEIAIKVLQSLLANGARSWYVNRKDMTTSKEYCELAYSFADDMLAERNK